MVLVKPGDKSGHIEGEWIDYGNRFSWSRMSDPDADVVVFQRPFGKHMFHAILELQRRGVRVVCEIDDDADAVDPRHPFWRSIQPSVRPDHNRDWLRWACEVADLVTVTTPALARRYGGHGRVSILPNYVPARLLNVKRTRDGGAAVIGWTGTVASHPNDLQVMRGGLQQALNDTGATFMVVGDGQDVGRAAGIGRDPISTGWLPYEAYVQEVANLDVGIAPLDMTPFNEAKSWLRMLDMSAVGVAVVASPTGPNREFADLAGGLLAGKPRDWRSHIKRLVLDVDYRVDTATQARTAVAESFTIEQRCGMWWESWESTLTVRTAAK